MRAFDEHWGELDQVVAWAETRESEAVEYASFGTGGLGFPKSTQEIAIWSELAANAVKSGRDINAELWVASGWPVVKRRRTSAEIPSTEGLSRSELPEAKALVEAYANANENDRFFVRLLFSGDFYEADIPRLSTMAYLSPELRAFVGAYCACVEPPADFGDQPLGRFPTANYVQHLLRMKRLFGRGCLPGEILARDLTAEDWATLVIAPGGLYDRLCVWRRFPPANDRDGDLEQVRVRRAEVLNEFPPDPPPREKLSKEASDDDARRIIREAIAANGGFISQKNGADIVRHEFPGFNKERAMLLVKELTGLPKPGPHKRRQESSGKLSAKNSQPDK
jgi:hypothetical protein